MGWRAREQVVLKNSPGDGPPERSLRPASATPNDWRRQFATITPSPAMNFPLEFRFKLLALASQIFVRDAQGALLLYVRQKMFKLKEDVVVYGDTEQTQPLYRIRADRILDFRAEYRITDATTEALLGSIRRQGMRSLWRARYDVSGANGETFSIHEESVMVRIIDGIVGQIPILGALAGYVFNAAFRVTRASSGEDVLRVVKRPALFEGRFQVESLGAVSEGEQRLLVLGALMMVLLERERS